MPLVLTQDDMDSERRDDPDMWFKRCPKVRREWAHKPHLWGNAVTGPACPGFRASEDTRG